MTLEIKLLKQWLEEQISWLEGMENKIYDQNARGYIDGKLEAFREVYKKIE